MFAFVCLDNARTISETAEIYRQPAHITASSQQTVSTWFFFTLLSFFSLGEYVRIGPAIRRRDKMKKNSTKRYDALYIEIKLNINKVAKTFIRFSCRLAKPPPDFHVQRFIAFGEFLTNHIICSCLRYWRLIFYPFYETSDGKVKCAVCSRLKWSEM